MQTFQPNTFISSQAIGVCVEGLQNTYQFSIQTLNFFQIRKWIVIAGPDPENMMDEEAIPSPVRRIRPSLSGLCEIMHFIGETQFFLSAKWGRFSLISSLKRTSKAV